MTQEIGEEDEEGKKGRKQTVLAVQEIRALFCPILYFGFPIYSGSMNKDCGGPKDFKKTTVGLSKELGKLASPLQR